jgi:glycosyltransferase involved in cell wall biosynthesis
MLVVNIRSISWGRIIVETNVFIVVPCFEEARRWPEPDYWREVMQQPGICLIFVNDGSRDSTAELIAATINGTHHRQINLSTNLGKAEAVRAGFLSIFEEEGGASSESLIGFLDADGAFPARSVSEFYTGAIKKIVDEQYDAVWSSRVALSGRNIERSANRHYLGRIISTWFGLLFGDLPYDSQSGLKIFRASESLREASAYPYRTRWMFDLELLSRLLKSPFTEDYKIWEEPVTAWAEVGKSHIKGKEFIRIVGELFVITSILRNLSKESR